MTKIEKLLNLLNEKAYKNADELSKDIETEIKKVFPKSFVDVNYTVAITPTIAIRFALGKDKSEWSNAIIHNDILHHIMFVGMSQLGRDGSVPDKVTVDLRIGDSILTKPKEGSYMAFDRIKIGFRKKTDTPEKVVKYISDYFKKAKSILLSNKDKLRPEDRELADKY